MWIDKNAIIETWMEKHVRRKKTARLNVTSQKVLK
jgi:hypothetical protein